MLGDAKRMLGWSAATAALWAVGWTVTTAGGIDVEQQWVVFGAYGCITVDLPAEHDHRLVHPGRPSS